MSMTTLHACNTCGNLYDKSFQIILNDQEYWFDSFECAIEKLAPKCTHCHMKIIGHGIDSQGSTYCCSHCARVHDLKVDHQDLSL
jgi:hypothetical protein